ncbi:hypothetical protein Q9L58_002471 [Maublancomyces gigas]|uniref:Uncharacterized protein n=1 Tax=Discina gigas TaxID=1032678 RepID=A0ABR3GRK9_9PEZI
MPSRISFFAKLQPLRTRLPLHSLSSPNAPQFSTSTRNAFGGVKMKRVSSSTSPTLLAASKAAALQRRRVPQRVGALAIKKGMTAIYLPNGRRIPVTVLQLDRVQVMATKTPQKHGYWGLQVGLGWRNPKNITKPMLGHFEVCGVAPKKAVKEFRVKDETGLLKPATVIGADHFIEGQYVDVQANCKGKGFAGVCLSNSLPPLLQELTRRTL